MAGPDINDLSAEEAFALGIAAYADDHPSATPLLERSLVLNVGGPEAVTAALILGDVSADLEQVARYYERALRMPQENVVAVFSDRDARRGPMFRVLGLYWSTQGRKIEERNSAAAALAYLEERERLISRLPATCFPHLHLSLGVLRGNLGRHDAAISSFENAIRAEIPFEEDGPDAETFRQAKRLAQRNLFVASQQSAPAGTTQPAPAKTTTGCWIATAACGQDSAEVYVLTRFRDEVLETTTAGRAFIRTYYWTSPAVARIIARRPVLQRLVRRAILRPLVIIVRGVLNGRIRVRYTAGRRM